MKTKHAISLVKNFLKFAASVPVHTAVVAKFFVATTKLIITTYVNPDADADMGKRLI